MSGETLLRDLIYELTALIHHILDWGRLCDTISHVTGNRDIGGEMQSVAQGVSLGQEPSGLVSQRNVSPVRPVSSSLG